MARPYVVQLEDAPLNAVKIIAFVGVAMIVSGLLGGLTAGFKNRDASSWAAYCFLFPPTLLLLLLLPKNTGPLPRRPPIDAEDHHDW